MPSINSDVVILARTKMSGDKICVGAYDIANNRAVRLLDERANAYTAIAPFKVGEIYNITYAERYDIVLPHSEDVAVYKYTLNSSNNALFIGTQQLLRINLNNLCELFGGKLTWTNNSGHLLKGNTTDYSVTIATLNCDLIKNNGYFVQNIDHCPYKVKYVGCEPIQNLPDIIRAGTRIRFSLARWWDNNGTWEPHRSYLQLSGVY